MAFKRLTFGTLIWRLTAWLLLTVAAVCGATTDPVRFNHLMQNSEDSVGEVMAIAEDSYGFMWIGGRNGLARYNAYEYTIFRHDPDNPDTIAANAVYDIVVDKKGQLWIASEGGLNRFNYKNNRFIRYQYDVEKSNTLAHNSIFRLHLDKAGVLWLATREGLNRYNPSSDDITRFPRSPLEKKLYTQYTLDLDDDGKGKYYIATGFGLKIWNSESGDIKHYDSKNDKHGTLHNHLMRTILRDSQGRIWVGTDGGLHQFIEEEERFIFYPSEMDEPGAKWGAAVWDIFEDQDGNIWAAYDGQGISFLAPDQNSLITYQNSKKDLGALNSNVVRRIADDASGDVWVGLFPYGVDVFSKYSNAFRHFKDSTDDERSINADVVRSIHETPDRKIWVGTDGGGINIWDPDTRTFSVIERQGDAPNQIAANEVLAMMEDNQGRIWMGSWSSGVTVYNPADESFKLYQQDANNSNSITINQIWDIYQTRNGDIWIATISGGLNKYIPDIDGFISYHHHVNREDTIGDERIWALLEDKEGYLWAATQTGLSRYDYKTDSFKTYLTDKNNPGSLKSNRILSLHEDKRGRLWIGTHGAGLNLFNREDESFVPIRKRDGLLSNIVNAILEDDDGNLWFSSDKGISQYNPDTGKIKNYTHVNGVQSGEFNIGAAHKLRNGYLMFGGLNGVTFFRPEDIIKNTVSPKTIFTQLDILNKKVIPGDEIGILEASILMTDHITLNYKQNVFSIHYAGLSYRSSERNTYEYKLEGFDSDWRNVGVERKTTYTNLDAGEYIFKVRSANNEGVWGDTASLAVTVLPPPWKTWWAYTLYVLTVLSIVGWYIYTQRKILESERVIVNRLTKLDKLKDEFLANTSHELRTPLFGMVGLAEGMIDNASHRLSKMDMNNLSMIVASGRRLSSIVEDILDFSQIRNHTMKVEVKPVGLNAVSSIVVALTQPLVAIDRVKIVNDISIDLPPVSADENRLQQIFHNLVGNAIKFTRRGEIRISAKEKEDVVEICVKDTGIGIPESRFNELFDAFTQVETSDTRSQGGTGLGLAITKNLVEMHGGEIWFKSKEGEGSEFYFTMPIYDGEDQVTSVGISEKVINKLQYSGVSSLNVDVEEHEEKSYAKDAVSKSQYGFEPRIMIVDDEPVNRRVLRNHLASQGFDVVDAENGHHAIQLFELGERVDLVLMDVMMPMMSGYECCVAIRKNISRHSLPIIFITAKFQLQDVIAGFDAGGNDFLSKPISRQELLARVDLHLQLLEASRNLEQKVEARTEELKKAYEQLEQLSLSDPLTGLGNRRFFEKFIDSDASEARRKYINWIRDGKEVPHDGDLVFIVIDIDKFKSVNDTYGHAAGDKVLVTVAGILKEASRKSDYIVRWGGEEFLIVARFLSRDNAKSLTERIRANVEKADIDIGDGQTLQVTCSLGYAGFPLNKRAPNHYEWEEVIKIADRALYASKFSGRNSWIGLASVEENVGTVQEVIELIGQGKVSMESSFKSFDDINWDA